MNQYKDIVKQFNLEVLVNNEIVMNTEVPNKHFSNGAYELTGESKKINSPVIFGGKELLIFEKSKHESLKIAFEKLFASGAKSIFLTRHFNEWVPEVLLEEAKKNGAIVLFSKTLGKASMRTKIPHYVAHNTSQFKQIHASLVNVFGYGIAIIGKSGIGKSELVLDLIQKGHFFIADDSVQIRSIGNELYGSSPRVLKNLLEVRGIGIINVRQVHGIQSLSMNSKIDLVIELTSESTNSATERVGDSYETVEFIGHVVPKIKLPVNISKNISGLVETAVVSYKLKKEEGYSAVEESLEAFKK